VTFFFSLRSLKNPASIFTFSLAVAFTFLFILGLSGCFEVKDSLKNPTTTPTGSASVTVSWDDNRESGVNSAGGGYRVYYATSSNVSTASNANVVVVPYATGPKAPTTVTIENLAAGDWYIKVVAYAAYNPGMSSAAKSADSPEFKVTVQ
jgi:hypothetical protein